jgi:hypothetical protein
VIPRRNCAIVLLSLLILGTMPGCGGSSLGAPDGAVTIRCPLSTELTFRWIGFTAVQDTHRLIPPAGYEGERKDAPRCTKQVPDCQDAGASLDLGELNLALQHPDVTASWPGTGQRVFTFDPPSADGALTFEVEAPGRGQIVVSPNCEPSGCVLPPAGVLALSRTLRGVLAHIGTCP